MSAAEDCPLCDDGIIVTVHYSWTGDPPEREGTPCWRCLEARAEKAEAERDAVTEASRALILAAQQRLTTAGYHAIELQVDALARLVPIDPALDAELAEFQSGTTVAKRIAQAREENDG